MKYLVISLVSIFFIFIIVGMFFLFRGNTGYFNYYLLDNLDDIVEGIFEIIVLGIVAVIGVAFLKKIWHKL
ncbi:hypothetical protein R4I97_03585 [Brachyspira pilosicoli]|uniref:hypothetical protein n=1 Tax=Brachyspira pilosicoli TaxID=52584 RepID=UPI0030043548